MLRDGWPTLACQMPNFLAFTALTEGALAAPLFVAGLLAGRAVLRTVCMVGSMFRRATVSEDHGRKRRDVGSNIGYMSYCCGALPSRQALFLRPRPPRRQAQWMWSPLLDVHRCWCWLLTFGPVRVRACIPRSPIPIDACQRFRVVSLRLCCCASQVLNTKPQNTTTIKRQDRANV